MATGDLSSRCYRSPQAYSSSRFVLLLFIYRFCLTTFFHQIEYNDEVNALPVDLLAADGGLHMPVEAAEVRPNTNNPLLLFLQSLMPWHEPVNAPYEEAVLPPALEFDEEAGLQ